jgi:hypothetical protein
MTDRDRIAALVAKWRKEADEAGADGDFCCALTRRNDADDLTALLRAEDAQSTPTVLEASGSDQHGLHRVVPSGGDSGQLQSLRAEDARPQVDVQELYDATTVLIAALTFTHCTEDLVKPELNNAIERVIYARNGMQRTGAVIHRDAALCEPEASR